MSGWYATPAACAGAPASVAEIDGTADDTVPLRASSAGDWLRRWRRSDGCGDPPTQRFSRGVAQTSWRCARGLRIEQVRLQGVGHGWPGEPALAPAGRYVRFNATDY